MSTTKHTFVYKTATVPIELDVYLPATPSASAQGLPILVWFHGGGLLQSSRKDVAPHHIRGVTKHGYVFISVDYRLAPQVGVSDILEDVKDSLKWITTELPTKLEGGDKLLDTTRLAVSGSSAGGYLALLAGLYSTEPKPKVILPIYPITNPFGKFFTTPQPHPLGHLERSVVESVLDPNAPVVTSDNGPEDPRSKFYPYMLQEANLAQLLHVKESDEEFVIPPQIRKRGSYLPTFIIHGDADKFVGVEQSDEVVDALKEVGAEIEYERPKGQDHFLDVPENVELDGYYAFLKKHV